MPKISKPVPSAYSGAHTTHLGQYHAVYSRNLARAELAILNQPTRHLAHHAHYVDNLPRYGERITDHVLFHVEKYMAAADAVGAWG